MSTNSPKPYPSKETFEKWNKIPVPPPPPPKKNIPNILIITDRSLCLGKGFLKNIKTNKESLL